MLGHSHILHIFNLIH